MRFLILLLFFASSVSAQPLAVTNTFSNNTVADAAHINQNFEDIVAGVNAKLRTDNGSPYATAVGYEALENNVGSYNTAVGLSALFRNEEGEYNTALGASALQKNTSGDQNTGIGYRALYYNYQGDGNTAVGFDAMHENQWGWANTSVGAHAMFSNTTGDKNVALGYQALYRNTVGVANIAIGYQALYQNLGGSDNTANGWRALYSNSSGIANTATGFHASWQNISGQSNTAIGRSALAANRTGSYNTAVGRSAGSALDGLNNTTAIGYNAQVTSNNMVRIGNTTIDIIEGAVPFSVNSDARLKESVKPVIGGLALISDLNPVTYHRIQNANADMEMGLLAQEVDAALRKHGFVDSGMVYQPDNQGYMSVRYNDLLAPMIKAIQELDEKNQRLEIQLKSEQAALLAVVQAQHEQIAELQRVIGEQFVAR